MKKPRLDERGEYLLWSYIGLVSINIGYRIGFGLELG
jgi:hypothetical protein